MFWDLEYGSSPHTWGIPSTRSLDCCFDRFIPTYVGNTVRCSFSAKYPPVHPHIRGEHWWLYRARYMVTGSSPHTWGTPLNSYCCGMVPRFIPTYVGNTNGANAFRIERAVHPHIRGEHFTLNPLFTLITGSSPHTWGTHGISFTILTVSRFIPTYVGNTSLEHRYL